MKIWKLSAACLVAISLIGGSAWSRPVDLSAPSGELGAANSKGYLEIWREIPEVGIDFGPGSYLSLRYKFSSDNNTGGVLGPGFYCPMLEAKSVLIREDTMRAYLPCGKGLYLWRDPADSTKFLTPDKEWTGALSGNGDFTAWRNDGWTIVYQHGRLTSIRTDARRVFTWDYDGNTSMATRISENFQPIVTVEANQQGFVKSIIFNAKRYELGYAKRPLMEILQGQPVVKELALALSSFKYPDGKTETFQFALTPERVPTATFTDPDKKQTVYTWDAATSHIATEQGPDGNWTYHVGDIPQDYDQPPISRTNSDGKTEAMAVDKRTGTYTEQEPDNTTTVTHVFETPGPLYHKVKFIEKITNGVTTTIYKASYDEAGRLIRKMDEKGFITQYTYDPSGKLLKQIVMPPCDPATLQALKQKEAQFLDLIKNAAGPNDKLEDIEQLAYFYVDSMGDYKKALSLVPRITDANEALDVQVMAICRNDSLSNVQKAKELKSLKSTDSSREPFLQRLISKYNYAASQTNN